MAPFLLSPEVLKANASGSPIGVDDAISPSPCGAWYAPSVSISPPVRPLQVADDAMGRDIISELEEEGIDTSHIIVGTVGHIIIGTA